MFVNHIFATAPQLPPMGQHLYEYVIGSNGVFVRAKRPEMEALIWVAATQAPVRGLAEVKPYARLTSRIPALLLARMYEMAYRAGNNEILFYLVPNPWRIVLPEQVQTGVSVRPVDPYAGGANTVVEVHSHHSMGAFFSKTDDREENTGFRLYTVLGNLLTRPAILCRVGIFGHFWQIPAAWVFDLPAGVNDALYPILEYEEIEDASY
jgi:PRTRC genetic system protein A